jgi:cysteinyl-tRNA synthetase
MWPLARIAAKIVADLSSALSLDAEAVPVPGTRKSLYLHNTMTGAKEEFSPLSGKTVKMYNCGPTVYGPQHIGNLSMFVFVDILRRTLEYNDYTVKQVINFTDFGHLTSDADEGEDKMAKGLKREGLSASLENMRTLGEKYAALFLADLAQLNVKTEGTQFPRASDYIPAQVAMIKALEEKTYAYQTKKGVYFDTAMFADYGKLGNINLEGLREGARVEAESEKRNPTDFILWKPNRRIGWNSPWGKGFPGWHIECSAMSRSLLGDQLDIHTGGIEHIPIHHNNEIAQSEAATGKKPFVRFWLHRAHLQIGGEKIAKSVGNTVYLSDITEKDFPPLAFRYLLLGAHYRSSASFTWETLKAAQQSLFRLYNLYENFVEAAKQHPAGLPATSYRIKFHERINDDLDTPGALAVLWELTKDADVSPQAKVEMMHEFDGVLGLSFGSTASRVTLDALDDDIQKLIDEREAARAVKNWQKADELRDQIESRGYTLEDKPEGPRVLKK